VPVDVSERRALVDAGGVRPGTQGHRPRPRIRPVPESDAGAFVFGPQRRNEEDTGRRAHLVEVGRNGLCWIEAGAEAPVEVSEALRGWLIAAIGLALAGAAVLGGTLPAHASPTLVGIARLSRPAACSLSCRSRPSRSRSQR
jgi:hypothetical protein